MATCCGRFSTGSPRPGPAWPSLTLDDLAPVDEFHIGGRQATVELADRLDLRPDLRVLDVGCRLGGASRYLARRFGVQVAAVDLTPEFVLVLNRAANAPGPCRVASHEDNGVSMPLIMLVRISACNSSLSPCPTSSRNAS